jgi:uncharacterized protein (UPF0212 family)
MTYINCPKCGRVAKVNFVVDADGGCRPVKPGECPKCGAKVEPATGHSAWYLLILIPMLIGLLIQQCNYWGAANRMEKLLRVNPSTAREKVVPMSPFERLIQPD